MADKVNWIDTMQEATQRAKSEGKPILLDFFNPH
jgi:uncharacterized protein YyaL (SSP411 family)